MMKKTSMIVGIIIFLMSLGAYSQTLNTGPWRFELRTTHAKVPFIINFKKSQNKYTGVVSKNKYTGILKNGKESIELPDLEVEKHHLSIPLQTYELSLEMDLLKDGVMSGYLVRHNKNPKIKTPVVAVHGKAERYTEGKSKPTIDLTGRWGMTLVDEQDKKEKGVIVFKQKGKKLTGSILTPNGDYRYLEGFVSRNEFEAASFDGVYNYVLKGKVTDGKLEAAILSNYRTTIEGKKDDKAQLPDAYKQTRVKSLNFKFPDLRGNKVSLNDPKFKGKPVIIQFFGSWCPNCLDEMNYLIPWYNENKKRGIEIIALAFERSLSAGEAKKQLVKTKIDKKIPYTLLLAGSTSEDKPMDKIPGLKNFISFPTTVFLNKKHEVVKVHAGFTGPSTGEFYEKWKTEFNSTVNELLK